MTDKKTPLVLVDRANLEIAVGFVRHGYKNLTDQRSDQDNALRVLRESLDNQHINTEEIANHAAQAHLDSRGASNYVIDTYTISRLDTPDFEISVTVQKIGAVTPGDRVNSLQEGIAELIKHPSMSFHQVALLEAVLAPANSVSLEDFELVPMAENKQLQELLKRKKPWDEEKFKTPEEMRVEALEKALAGMLFAFDDGVGRDWSAPLLDHARTLVKAEEFKG